MEGYVKNSGNTWHFEPVFLWEPIQRHREERNNVKRKQLLSFSIALIVAALVFACHKSAQVPVSGGTGKPIAKPKITVLNPAVTSKMVNRTPLAPRLETLEGKTLYLVDISWGGPEAAYSVFEEMQSWFAEKMPGVKIVIKRKTGMYTQDDPQLWREIAQKGNAALIGISG
jgi:hypothetical protein